MLALLAAFAAAIALVLADSGLRLWSALGGIKAQRGATRNPRMELPRRRATARVTTQVSYGRTSRSAPLRAAA